MGVAAVYFQGFEAGSVDGWVQRDSATALSVSTTKVRTGVNSLNTFWSSASSVPGAKRTLTGLTIGVQYTFSAYAMTENTSGQKGCYIGITGMSNTAITYRTSTDWILHSITFTATATSHELLLGMAGSFNSALFYWDDISVTRPVPDSGNMLMMFS